MAQALIHSGLEISCESAIGPDNSSGKVLHETLYSLMHLKLDSCAPYSWEVVYHYQDYANYIIRKAVPDLDSSVDKGFASWNCLGGGYCEGMAWHWEARSGGHSHDLHATRDHGISWPTTRTHNSYTINRNAAWRVSILCKNVCSVTDQILQILILPWGLPSNIMK